MGLTSDQPPWELAPLAARLELLEPGAKRQPELRHRRVARWEHATAQRWPDWERARTGRLSVRPEGASVI